MTKVSLSCTVWSAQCATMATIKRHRFFFFLLFQSSAASHQVSLPFETELECTHMSSLCVIIHPCLMHYKSVYVSVDGIDF